MQDHGAGHINRIASLLAKATSRDVQAGTPNRFAFAGVRVTIPANKLRGSARIAGSTRLVVMSPTPITIQRIATDSNITAGKISPKAPTRIGGYRSVRAIRNLH